jgi:DNA-binding MarR family transcriptional regulator
MICLCARCSLTCIGASMVDGFLGSLTTEQRTLMHLFDNKLPSNQWEAPSTITQAGISAAVHVQRKHVPRTLKRLEGAGDLSVVNRHIPGAKQRRKVYSLTDQGRDKALQLRRFLLSHLITKDEISMKLEELLKGGDKMLDLLSHIDEKMIYHDSAVISPVSNPEGEASLDAQAGEQLVKRMFARAWEDGKITKDEQQLITEVVQFLGMHPERVVRLSEQARKELNVPPPEEIYLDMLRQALVDDTIIDEEIALLDTFRVAFGIDLETHERLLNDAKKDPVYPPHVQTYHETLITAMDDGIITEDEEAMLLTLRNSLSISDGEHASLLANIRDNVK